MKPPVEAPTSRQIRPSMGSGQASSGGDELLRAARRERSDLLDGEFGVVGDSHSGLRVALAAAVDAAGQDQ